MKSLESANKTIAEWLSIVRLHCVHNNLQSKSNKTSLWLKLNHGSVDLLTVGALCFYEISYCLYKGSFEFILKCIWNNESLLIVVLTWNSTVQLTIGEFFKYVSGDKLDLCLMILQLGCLLTSGLKLFLFKCKDGVIQDLTERIVEKLAHGHVSIRFFIFEILEHLLEHRFGIAWLHSFLSLLRLIHVSWFIVSVELNLF